MNYSPSMIFFINIFKYSYDHIDNQDRYYLANKNPKIWFDLNIKI